jgi:hypothetical protein
VFELVSSPKLSTAAHDRCIWWSTYLITHTLDTCFELSEGWACLTLHSLSNLDLIFKTATLISCSTFICDRYLLFIAVNCWKTCFIKWDIAEETVFFIAFSLKFFVLILNTNKKLLKRHCRKFYFQIGLRIEISHLLLLVILRILPFS